MRGKTTVALLAVAALCVTMAPNAQAAATCPQPSMCPRVSTPTTLYFHIFDVFNNFPINTQMPQSGFFKVGGTNFPSAQEPTSGTNYNFNTLYGYSTSGPVEYNFIENGQPRFHPERGIAADVDLDANAPATVYLYVDVRDFLGTHTTPDMIPGVTFNFEMRQGNQLGVDAAALDSGNLIMAGSKVVTLASKDFSALNNTSNPADNSVILTPDANGVIEIKIPMPSIATARITKADGYHVKIWWYQSAGGQGSQYQASEGFMRLVQNGQYHPRMELSIMDPVYIDFIHPEVAAGILLIHTAENSPWGTYDADVANMTVGIADSNGPLHVTVLDPGGNTIYDDKGSGPAATLQIVISQNSHVHNLHDKSAEVTYLWRFRDQDAHDGTYTITVNVQNDAHTAKATGTAQFVLEGKKAYGLSDAGQVVTASSTSASGKSSPGAGLAVLLAVVGAALVLRRRAA